MAQQFYPIDLQDTVFPMLSEQQGRTVIGSEKGKSPSREERPSVAYCHNVMPSKYGFDSIAYLDQISAIPDLPVGVTITDVRVAYGDQRSRVYFAWSSVGDVYALLEGATTWLFVFPKLILCSGFT